MSGAGRIARDLLRLCLFVQETPSSAWQNGRYLFAVFDREPGAYLAFTRQSGDASDRTWLRTLLSPGRHQLEISLAGEAKSFLRGMGKGFVGLEETLVWSIDVVTHTFEPTATPSEPASLLYWGYLVRIVHFVVRFGADELVYRDGASWSEEQVARQERLAERVLGLMGS